MACLTAPQRFFHTSMVLLLSCTAFVTQARQTDSAAITAWPSKPVRIVVAFPPAGAADILARSVGEVLQRDIQQSFVIDNRPGAGGNIGTDNVAKSAADGYTMLIGIDTTFTVNPFIYKSMPFKNSDLRPVAVLASQGMAVAVNPKTELRTLEQFIERGKKKGLTLSSAGYGAPGHLAATILTHATGARITHIPYKGNAPASTSILAGEVDGGVLSVSALISHIQAGKVNALAVTTPKRNPLLPHVPTMAELGHKDLEQEILFALWVPASMPDSLVKKIELAIGKALQDKPLQERMRSNDLIVEGLTGEAATRRLQQLSDRYKTVILSTGMKME